MAFGERNYPYKATWKDTSKPSTPKQNNNWKRGLYGFATSKDDGDFLRDYDPAASDMMFGGAPNGAPADPSQITDKFKGYRGVDE